MKCFRDQAEYGFLEARGATAFRVGDFLSRGPMVVFGVNAKQRWAVFRISSGEMRLVGLPGVTGDWWWIARSFEG